jgi:hypothetical protein
MQRVRRPLRKVRNRRVTRSAKELASDLLARLWPLEQTAENQPVSLLLDNAIYSLTDTVQAIGRKERVVVGSDQTVVVAGIQSKPRYGASASWKQAQIDSLPTIMRLAREGRLRLCTYQELTLERLGQKIGLRGMKGDLMKDIRPEHVPAAISRGKFEQMELFEFAKKVRVVAFCKLLLKLRYETLAPYPEVIARFTEFELGNLQLLDRFRELCLHVHRQPAQLIVERLRGPIPFDWNEQRRLFGFDVAERTK